MTFHSGICWYCHWGWPEQVAAIYHKAADEIGDEHLRYGPSHVVWEDENFGTECIQECIDNADRWWTDHDEGDKEVVLRSLRELLQIPESIRCCEPADYQGANPENFPPPEGIVMSRRTQ